MSLEKLKEFPRQKVIVVITIISFISFICLNLVMAPIERELKGGTGYGVLDFEFAWTSEMVRKIFRAWGSAGKKKEATAIYWDFLYNPAYSFFLQFFYGRLYSISFKEIRRKITKSWNIYLYITIYSRSL